MYFKSALAHLKSKIFSVANHGGWHFFTLETCWSYMFLLGPPLYINMTQKLLIEICQTSFWQLIKKKLKLEVNQREKKKSLLKNRNRFERKILNMRSKEGISTEEEIQDILIKVLDTSPFWFLWKFTNIFFCGNSKRKWI